MDVIRWLIGEERRRRISAHGRHVIATIDRTIPDTMEATFECRARHHHLRHLRGGGGHPIAGGEIRTGRHEGHAGRERGGLACGLPAPVSSRPGSRWWIRGTSDARCGGFEPSGSSALRGLREVAPTPWCPLEEGHRSTSFAHLANIALESTSRLAGTRRQQRRQRGANALLHSSTQSPGRWRREDDGHLASRREFLGRIGGRRRLAARCGARRRLRAHRPAAVSLSVFSKHLQHLDYRASRKPSPIGFDGIT